MSCVLVLAINSSNRRGSVEVVILGSVGDVLSGNWSLYYGKEVGEGHRQASGFTVFPVVPGTAMGGEEPPLRGQDRPHSPIYHPGHLNLMSCLEF